MRSALGELIFGKVKQAELGGLWEGSPKEKETQRGLQSPGAWASLSPPQTGSTASIAPRHSGP